MTSRYVMVCISVLVLTSCNEKTKEAPSEAVADITATTSAPAIAHLYERADKVSIRTVALTHNADSVQCSRNNGASFGACNESDATDNTHLIWNAADMNVNHVIRFTKAGAANSPYDINFKPSDQYPGVSLLTCDHVVSSNITFADFISQNLTGNNVVICLDAGVTVYSTNDNRISWGYSGTKVIGDYDDTTTEFGNVRDTDNIDTDSVLVASGKTNLKFYGVDFVSHGRGAVTITLDSGCDGFEFYKSGVYSVGSGSSGNYGLDIQDSAGSISDSTLVSSTGLNSIAAILYSSGAKTIAIANTYIQSDGLFGLYLNGSGALTVNVADSTLYAHGNAFYGDNASSIANLTDCYFVNTYDGYGSALASRQGTVNVTGSLLTSVNTSTSYGVLDITANQVAHTVTVTNSSIESSGSPAIKLGTYALGVHTVNVSNTQFKRLNAGVTGNPAIVVGANQHKVDSTGNGNLFCYAVAAKQWGSVISGSHAGNFVEANQANGGAVGACP